MYRARVKYPDYGLIGMASREGTMISEYIYDKNGGIYVVVDWDFLGKWEGEGIPPSYVSVEKVSKLICFGHEYYE